MEISEKHKRAISVTNTKLANARNSVLNASRDQSFRRQIKNYLANTKLNTAMEIIFTFFSSRIREILRNLHAFSCGFETVNITIFNAPHTRHRIPDKHFA